MSGYANSILGGASNLIRVAIQSPNYVPTASGWTVNKDGTAEFNNLTIRGTFAGLKFIINNLGAFFYSDIPTIGNLIASITSAAGIDGFGNAYVKGIATYGANGDTSYVQLLPGSGASTPARLLVGTGDAIEDRAAEFINFISGSGGGKTLSLLIQSPRVTGAAAAQISELILNSSTADLTTQPNASLLVSDGSNVSDLMLTLSGLSLVGAPLTATDGTAANPTVITTDTWHSLGTLAGYTVTVGRYRLTTWGAYELDINVTSLGANAANTTFSVALPAGYSGGSSIAYPLTANYVLTAGNAYPRLIVTSGGVVTIAQTASKSGLITGQAFVPAT